LKPVKKILSLEESRREVTCLKRAARRVLADSCPDRIPRRKENPLKIELERR
jgi:hypothetical protein